MKNFICKKCGNTIYIMREKLNGTGKAIGLYCAKCGTWHKWLNKEGKVLYSTHSAEIDYVADSKHVKMTKKAIDDIIVGLNNIAAKYGYGKGTEPFTNYEWNTIFRAKGIIKHLTAENKRLREEAAEQKSLAAHEHAAQMEWFRIACDYKAENAELKKRLDKAVELPCIEPMTTWDWDDTTGLGKNNFGKYWQVLYRDKDGEFIAYIGATKEEAEARLAELKGGKE